MIQPFFSPPHALSWHQPLFLDNHGTISYQFPQTHNPNNLYFQPQWTTFSSPNFSPGFEQSSLLETPSHWLSTFSLDCWPSLALSLDIIYWAWILALLWQGVCSLNQQVFIKYLQMVTLTNMWPWASYLTSLSLNFLIRKKKVTMTTFKSYIENYMRQSSFQTLYISLLQTVILYPSPPSPLPIMKAFSQLGLKPLVTHCVYFSFIPLKALRGPYFVIAFLMISATVS